MLNKIIQFSLTHRLFILAAALLLVIAGLYATRQMDVDVFPDITAPTVVVMTDAHGLAPEEVERLVTFPIETAVNGATQVRRVRSTSLQGSSFVFVEFDWGTDLFRARQVVSEKLTTLAEQLPDGLTPVMAPQSSVMGEILFVGLQLDTARQQQLREQGLQPTDMMELRTLADWVVKPAILGTGGVSQVTIIGGDYKQYQLLADPIRMRAYGVTMDQLAATAASLGANSTGGVVRDYGNEYALRGMARSADIEQLGRSLVTYREGRPVRLSDVADLVIAPAVKQGYASANAHPAIILSISKQPNINTLRVTQHIEENLHDIQQTLPSDVQMNTHIFRQADFITSSVGNVGKALLEGALCVIIVLFLFLGSLRTTFISILAIPLSLLGTMLCLHLLGMEVNTMTLGGMCIAIGSLVDDAIIDVENVYKRLRQNHQLPLASRRSAYDVVFHGSAEIRSSVIHATFIIMITFVPLFFLSGLEGRMLKPLGIAYLISLFMSLLVALTVTPLLCRLLLSGDAYLDRRQRQSAIASKLTVRYQRLLTRALDHRRIVIGVTLVALLLSVGLFFTMGRGFLPEFNEGSLTISVVAKPGISLEQSNAIGNLVEQQLLDIPEVTSTSRRTGRGELDEHSQATNGAEIDVSFQLGKRSKQDFMADVRSRLAALPGIATSVGQPLGHRIDHMVSGTQAAIAIKVFGPDLSQLYRIGTQIQSATADIEGLVDLNVEQLTETPQLQIRADRDRLAQYGITIEEFNHFVNNAFQGEQLAEIYEGQRAFPLILKQQPVGVVASALDQPPTIDQVRNALIDGADGAKVPLSQVAEIVSVGGPSSISRENVQRKLVVSANVSGRDPVSVVQDIQRIVQRQVSLPEGYRIEYGGQFESAQSATRTLLLVFLLSLLVIYLLLYTEFRNFTLSAIVLLNLPLALIGGVLAVKCSSNLLSIPALIGFITLFGIATRNGILLVARYQALQKETAADQSDPAVGPATNPAVGPATNSAVGPVTNPAVNTETGPAAEFADAPTESQSASIPVRSTQASDTPLRSIVIQGSIDRFNPIIMTALTTALSLIPMLLAADKPGNEIQAPMAVVVLGGLITSTLLNLLVVPIVYQKYASHRASRQPMEDKLNPKSRNREWSIGQRLFNRRRKGQILG